MKTAEQIAEEIVNEITTGGTIAFAGLGYSPTLHEMERAIVLRAIEADREYRAADLAILADAAAEWSRELTDYIIPEAAGTDRAGYETTRDAIQAALGRYLDEQEAQA